MSVEVGQKVRGYYAVVDRDEEEFARKLIFECTPHVIQLRLKGASTREILDFGKIVLAHCRGAEIPLVSNDRIDIAISLGADGVHLGQDDLSLADARKVRNDIHSLGNEFLIGISTHNREQVVAAVQGGATYLGYGPIFTTKTKQNPDPIQGIDALRIAIDFTATTVIWSLSHA